MIELIKKTLLGAIGYVIEYKFIFIRILILPCIFMSFLELLIHDGMSFWLSIFIMISEWLVYVLLAISTHRVILLGPDSISTWGFYIPGARELQFFGTAFVLGLLMIPFSILSQAVSISQFSIGGWIIPFFLAAYFWGRLALVFPSIATDNAWTFQDSWNATKNYQVLMIAVVGIYPLLIELPATLISLLPYTAVIYTTLSLISLIFVVAALSVAFLIINKNEFGR